MQSRLRVRTGSAPAALLALLGVVGCGRTIVEPGAGCEALSDGLVALGVGETCVLDGPSATSFRVAASDGAEEYVVIVQSATRAAGSTTPIRLHVQGPDIGGNASISSSVRDPAAARDVVRDVTRDAADQASLM